MFLNEIFGGTPNLESFILPSNVIQKNSSGLPFVHARALGGFGGYTTVAHIQQKKREEERKGASSFASSPFKKV